MSERAGRVDFAAVAETAKQTAPGRPAGQGRAGAVRSNGVSAEAQPGSRKRPAPG